MTGTLWDFPTVCRVLDAHTSVLVDPSYWGPGAPPDHVEGVTAALVRRHQRMVRDYFSTSAVDDEPHAEDVRVRDRERPEFGQWEVRADWWPTTQEVELVGGHRDGDVILIPKPLDLAQLRLPQPPVTSPYLDQTAPATMAFTVQTFVLGGWNNETRRWRYTLEVSR